MHSLRKFVPPFVLEVHPQRSAVVVELGGELDCATAPRVARTVEELRTRGWDRIALDLTGMSFIDSTGLRLFLTLDARARYDHWRFELRGDSPALERLLTVTGLETWFTRS